jgi:hypothetical protein
MDELLFLGLDLRREGGREGREGGREEWNGFQ